MISKGEQIIMHDTITYIIFALLIVEGFIMMATGKSFFFNEGRYDAEALQKFSRHAGIASVLFGIGGLLFTFALKADPISKWMLIVSGVVLVIGFVDYSICHKKYLRKAK